MVDGEDKVAGIAVLPELAVEPGSYMNACKGIDLIGYQRAHGAERIKSLGACPLTILLLQVASGYIVGDGVAADVVAGILICADISALLANDDGHFSFEIHAPGKRGDHNRLARSDERRRRFEKQERFRGDLVA